MQKNKQKKTKQTNMCHLQLAAFRHFTCRAQRRPAGQPLVGNHLAALEGGQQHGGLAHVVQSPHARDGDGKVGLRKRGGSVERIAEEVQVRRQVCKVGVAAGERG